MLIVTALALCVRLAITQNGSGIQYVTFFPILALTTVMCGFWLGLFSSALDAALITYFLWPPFQTISVSFHYQTILSNGIFLLDAVFVCAVIEAMYRFHIKYVDTDDKIQLASMVFHNSREGLLVTNANGIIQMVNPAFTDITGYSEDEVIGQSPRVLRSNHQTPDFYQSLWRKLLETGFWQGELWNRRKNGEAFLEWLSISRINDHTGMTVRYVGIFHDVTELREKDARAHHLAFHDALTNLPNRALLLDRLEHALERAFREGRYLAVIFIDLDGFKSINDTISHAVGDSVLKEVGIRITSRLRSADTLARLGGDEFILLMEDIESTMNCAILAQKVIHEVSRPMVIGDHTLEVGASLGIACFPKDALNAQTLINCADKAMYSAKTAGRNSYRYFEQQMTKTLNPEKLTVDIS